MCTYQQHWLHVCTVYIDLPMCITNQQRMSLDLPVHVLVVLLVLLLQINRRLELLKIKILLVSFSPTVNVGDNLLVVEFNAPSINFLAVPSFTLHPCNVVTTSPI